MSDDFSIQGLLSESTVPDLFRSLVRSGETAVVTLSSHSRQDEIFFIEGRIVYASTSDLDLGLAEVLLRSGEINLKQYNDAHEKTLSNRRIGAVLCDLGYLAPEELTRALERQVRHIVTDDVALRDGSFVVDFGRRFESDIVHLPISTERLLLDAVSAIGQWSLIARGVSGAGRRFSQAPNSDAKIFHLDLTEEENYLYTLLSEFLTIEQICERSYLTDFSTCRLTWALLTANLVGDSAPLEDVAVAAERDEIELEGEVERYNSTFQAIFDLVFQKIGDHTYDFVDRVALHVSPEMMPYLSGVNLINEGRVDYDQLINNLIASGSADRGRVVRLVFNEMLYGWIVEIKREFGTKLDAEVERLVAPLRS